MNITTKTNGYEISDELKTMVQRVEHVASVLFPNWEMKHFYYGNKLVMTDIVNRELNQYVHFNITKNRVSINGYTASRDNLKLFESMTHNDELYDGRLLKLVNF